MSSRPSDLEILIHDVNSKCASLKSAVVLLKQSTKEETQELLSLMIQQTRNLTQNITDFEKSWRGR